MDDDEVEGLDGCACGGVIISSLKNKREGTRFRNRGIRP